MARILIVDDSEMTHGLIERMLKGEFEVFEHASDGQAALKMLENAHMLPTVIVTDLEMPEMRGDAMIREILKSEVLSQIPLVLCSSSIELPTIAAALGVRHFQKDGSLLALKPILLAMRDEYAHDGTHATHCCDKHGCKYGHDKDCPVESGRVKQENPCENCGMGDPDNGFYDGEMVWHPSLRDLLLAIHGDIGPDGSGKLSAATLGELTFAAKRIRVADESAVPEDDGGTFHTASPAWSRE
jgi:CheY-like chemotaxis protein